MPTRLAVPKVAMPTRHTAVSLFSSWLRRLDLQAWMALASCPARQGQQRSLRRIRQFLSLGVCPFAGGAELRVSPVASLCDSDLFFPGTGSSRAWFPGSPLSASVTSPAASSSARTPQAGPPPASLTSAADRPGEHRSGQRHTRRQPRKREPAGRREPHRVRGGRDLYTNIVPSGPEGDAAYDVTVTPITGTGSVPRCDIPAFDPPLPGNLGDAPPGGSEVARGGPSLATT
jgi:hypothetical protein